MDAQDFRSLQEAYSQVYDEEYNELPVQKMIGQIGRKLKVHDPNYYKPGALTQAKELVKVMDTHSERKARKKSKLKKEEVDIYDIILSHLLDEGYAETQEQAEVIMVNMSEDWRESICEEYKKLPVGKMIRQASNKTIDGLEYQDGSKETPKGQDSYTAANRPWGHIDKMQKIANNHNPTKAKRKEDDNRRIGGRKRDAGRPRSNELQDNW